MDYGCVDQLLDGLHDFNGSNNNRARKNQYGNINRATKTLNNRARNNQKTIVPPIANIRACQNTMEIQRNTMKYKRKLRNHENYKLSLLVGCVSCVNGPDSN